MFDWLSQGMQRLGFGGSTADPAYTSALQNELQRRQLMQQQAPGQQAYNAQIAAYRGQYMPPQAPQQVSTDMAQAQPGGGDPTGMLRARPHSFTAY